VPSRLAFAFGIFVLFFAAGAAAKRPRHRNPSTAELVFARSPDLRGAPDPEALAKENKIADDDRLPRIEDGKELAARIKSGFLVAVPEHANGFYLDRHLKKEMRYIAPAALAYIEAISGAYSNEFGARKKKELLKITSLVRTEEYQRKLARRNANAAKGNVPEKRTVHTTGYAFDISTKGMPRAEIIWLADFFEADVRQCRALAIYEHKGQQDFHVFVIPKSASAPADRPAARAGGPQPTFSSIVE